MPAHPLPDKLRSPRFRSWINYAIAACFAAWCIHALRKDFAQINAASLMAGWSIVLAATGLSLVNYVLRVARWHMYLRKLGHRLPLAFVALTFMAGFAFTLSPGKLGEMVRARYYRPLGVSLPAIAGAFITERLLDLVAMLVLAAMVLAEFPDYSHFLWWALAVVSALLVSVAVLPRFPFRQQTMSRWPRWIAKPVTSLSDTLASARSLLAPAVLVSGVLLGLLAWGVEAWGLKLLCDVVAPGEVGLNGAMGAYAIAILIGALSFLPGGLGSTEAVMAALLHAQGVSIADALLLTLVCRLLTLWLAVAIGWLCVWWLPKPSPEA